MYKMLKHTLINRMKELSEISGKTKVYKCYSVYDDIDNSYVVCAKNRMEAFIKLNKKMNGMIYEYINEIEENEEIIFQAFGYDINEIDDDFEVPEVNLEDTEIIDKILDIILYQFTEGCYRMTATIVADDK